MARGYPDWEGGKSKVYSGADWAAIEATDVDETGIVPVAVPAMFYQIITYLVPAGSTLFISHYGGESDGVAGNVAAYLQNLTTGAFLAVSGGSQGFFSPFNKPARVPALQTVAMFLAHFGAANSLIVGHIGGYQL